MSSFQQKVMKYAKIREHDPYSVKKKNKNINLSCKLSECLQMFQLPDTSSKLLL